MKRLAIAAMIVGVLGCTVGLWGQTPSADPAAPRSDQSPGATEKPAAPSAGTTRPAPSTRPESDEEEQEEELIPEKFLAAAKDAFVICEFRYQKDLSESPEMAERDYRIRRIYGEYIDKKRPEERIGIVLDDKGTILITDDGLEDRFLKSVTVRGIAGETFPARRAKLLFDTPGIVLKVDAKAAGKLKGLRFAELPDNGTNAPLFRGGLMKSDDEWRIAFSPVYPSVKFAMGDVANVYYGQRHSGAYSVRYRGYAGSPLIIATEDGDPVGCAVATFLDLRQKECIWKGRDLLAAKGMTWGALNAAAAKHRAKLIDAVQEVILTLRAGDGEFDPDYSDRYSSRYSDRSGASGREISMYGVAISETEILIPRPLDSKMARQIDKVLVKFSPTDRKPATFVGAYKKFGAFVVKLEKGKLPAAVRLAAEDLPRMRPFWEGRIRKRFGNKYVDLIPNRLIGKARGYEGKYHWYPAREIHAGSMLVDFQGRVAGFYLPERFEHEEERRLERSQRYYSASPEVRLFLVSEIHGALTRPTAHMDPKIKVKPRALAKRRAWFGLEYVAMNPDLAEQFKVERATKDGQMGFVVNAVYPGSPAAKCGVQAGDILLRLQAPGMPYPMEFNSRMAGRERWGYRGPWGYGEEDMLGEVEPTWKPRTNFLTRVLDAVGVGKTVKIQYHRPDPKGEGEGKPMSIDYEIRQAPPDIDSARKWKNRKVGLTVKDLTYEVRYALNLQPADPGVIVAKVEPGSPMEVARIFGNEIITRLDDKPLTSAKAMRDLIAHARKDNKDKVRLTILRLGKTRFADLGITEYDPKEDEGLEEEE